MKTGPLKLDLFGLLFIVLGSGGAAADIPVGDRSVGCAEGPVFINGTKAGDVMAATIESPEPDKVGRTEASPFGFAGD